MDEVATMTERTCEHGFKLGGSHLPQGGWAGGVSRCQCCLSYFGYIDSGSYTANRSESVTNDTDLCPGCGGKKRRIIIENGAVVENMVID